MESTLRIYSDETTLVLDLNDPTAGYRTVALPDADRVWEQEWSENPRVDGASLNNERLGIVNKQHRTRIRAASWPLVEQRFEAMVAAIEVGHGFVVIGKGGVDRTWRIAGRASSSSPDSAADVLNRTRIVTWTIPVQPTAAITFPEEP